MKRNIVLSGLALVSQLVVSFAFAEVDRCLIVPHLATASNWQNLLLLSNSSTVEAEATLVLYQAAQQVSQNTYTVPANGESRIVVDSGECGFLFHSNPELQCRLVYRDLVRNGSAEFQLTSAQDDELHLFFPQYEGEHLAWAGFAVMNPQTFPLRVLVEARSASGEVLDTLRAFLGGCSRMVYTLDVAFDGIEPGSIASVSVSSTFPLAGLSIASIAQGQLLFLPAALDSPPTPPDANLKDFLDDWFSHYGEGKGMEYLDASFETFEQGDPDHPTLPAHVFRRDVPYGPCERNVMDFWQAESEAPTPVVVFIHGGGFLVGDKSEINTAVLVSCIEAGVSVAAINYRWTAASQEAAIAMEVPNGEGSIPDENGARLDYVLRDGARAVQFLRYKALDWHIDASKIAAFGGSAGGGISMWIGTIPDLAVRNHPDPVLRQSTRLCAVGHSHSQATYDWPKFAEHLGFPIDFVMNHIADEDVRAFQMSREDVLHTIKGDQVAWVLDFYAHMTRDDPPILTVNWNEDLTPEEITEDGEVIHHPRQSVSVYEHAKEVGIPCEISSRITSDGAHNGNIVGFFLDVFEQPRVP